MWWRWGNTKWISCESNEIKQSMLRKINGLDANSAINGLDEIKSKQIYGLWYTKPNNSSYGESWLTANT